MCTWQVLAPDGTTLIDLSESTLGAKVGYLDGHKMDRLGSVQVLYGSELDWEIDPRLLQLGNKLGENEL